MKTVGVIADTHGLLRPEAVAALAGVDLILHAGDIGRPAVLEQLRHVAPVYAVRGNNDRGPWADALPHTEQITLATARITLIHILPELAPGQAGDVVVHGHSHRPGIKREADRLYINPGSAGPRRFHLPVTVARLTLSDTGPEAEIVELPV